MQIVPGKTSTSLVSWTMAAGLVLRTFIAPGFMLDTTDGLSIIFCEGVAGAAKAARQSGHRHQHAHHQHDGQPDQQRHFTPSCTHWSTSGLLVINTFFTAVPLPTSGVLELHYQTPFLQQYSNILRPNRGPPPFRT